MAVTGYYASRSPPGTAVACSRSTDIAGGCGWTEDTVGTLAAALPILEHASRSSPPVVPVHDL